MRKIAAALAGLAIGVGISGSALAHVTVQPTEAPVGSFSRFVVRVPNERPDAATSEVEVRFPEILTSVSFQPKEGWKRSVKMKQLDEPIEVFGEEIDEVVGSVTWSGGAIEPGEFDEFGFSARVPDAETQLEFPALQTYDSGEVVRWIGPPDSEQPAALVAAIDLGIDGEAEGTLAMTAELQGEIDGLEAQLASDGSSLGNSDDSDLGVILGSIGIALGALALVVSFLARRS
jgi:periplasmic copper chaperone A